MVPELPVLAEIISVEPLNERVLRVFLKPERYVSYQAGQYLQILMAEEALAYSIANAPLGAHQYELHMRHHPTHLLHQHVLSDMKKEGALPLFLPLGNCHVGCLDASSPTWFIAQGTGFAPMKAIIEHWLAAGIMPPSVLAWLARSPSDWYLSEQVSHWVAHVPTFRYLPCLSSMSDETLTAHLMSLSVEEVGRLQVVLAGPFERMRHIRDVMMTYGLKAHQFFSDAFV